MREQRVARREEACSQRENVCSQHEKELARLTLAFELRGQERESERAEWEKFKADLEAVQRDLDYRNRELEALHDSLTTWQAALQAEKRELSDRSEKLSDVAQRLKQREASIDARETQLAVREATLSSRPTAVQRETELATSPAASPSAFQPGDSSLSGDDGPLPDHSDLPMPGTSGYDQIELPFSDDSAPSVIELYSGMGLADAEMSVLMADQIILRAAAEGVPFEDRSNGTDERVSVLSFSR